jgi:RNase P subunit RPR2
MQTYKKGVEFTGFVMLKCSCKNTTRFNVGIHALKGFAADGKTPLDLNDLTVQCPKCGKILRVALGQFIYGKYVKETICNSKCTGAIGHHCECSCGGKNHGGNWDLK